MVHGINLLAMSIIFGILMPFIKNIRMLENDVFLRVRSVFVQIMWHLLVNNIIHINLYMESSYVYFYFFKIHFNNNFHLSVSSREGRNTM